MHALPETTNEAKQKDSTVTSTDTGNFITEDAGSWRRFSGREIAKPLEPASNIPTLPKIDNFMQRK